MVPALVKRLTQQLADQGNANAESMAIAILKKRGHIVKDGDDIKLTAAGKQRQDLGNAGRAKDRAEKYSGGKHKASEYSYDSLTNRATLKPKKLFTKMKRM
jgi:hypothetical protein